jgi:Mg2+-importing ATPase
MLPLQVLLNNFLYDVSQLTIPSDRVDDADLQNPRRWNVGFIQRFMLLFGPASSLYDFLTFGAMLWLFHASAALFHTGWFVESLATQTLVILVIRTSGPPWRSRPSRALLSSVLGCVGLAVVLPYTPAATWLGFVPPPPAFFAFLLGVVVTYLAQVEGVKRLFYRRENARRFNGGAG